MSILDWSLLVAAAATAAGMNAVAGGGTFWLFPALMLTAGLDAKTANATNTFVLWIGSHVDDFRAAVPGLLLFATILFAFGPSLARFARWEGLHHHQGTSLGALLVLQLVVGVYGGFFGAGIGILMLALFGVAGMTDLHEMNSLKSMLATIINGCAAIAFVVAQTVAWQGYVLAFASAVGGFAASRFALRVHPERVRPFALAVAAGVTIYYFVTP
jgi:uncharacterized protein